MPNVALDITKIGTLADDIEAERPLAAVVELVRDAVTLCLPHSLPDPIALIFRHRGQDGEHQLGNAVAGDIIGGF